MFHLLPHVRARLRGIYTTALTYLLKAKGFKVVQQSAVIAERFGEDIVEEEADVTIKDLDEDRGAIFAMGEDMADTLRELFPYSFVWRSPVKLYSVIEPEDCQYAGFRVEPCLEKGLVLRPPLDGVIRLGEPKAVGKFAMVWRGEGRTYFSEHIDRDTKTFLLSISLPWNRKGYNVKWRSNARGAKPEELRDELSRLAVRFDAEDFKGQGDSFAVVVLSLPDKLHLDEVRGQVIKTTRFHHMIKTSDPELADGVDEGKVGLEDALKSLLREEMEIEHVKAPYEVVKLRKGVLVDFSFDGMNYSLVLRRQLRPGGKLDVLGMLIEEGDYDDFYLASDKWYGVHVYRNRQGGIKGVLVNIQTPTEVKRGSVRYLDLEVDVGYNNEKAIVADLEELDRKKEWLGNQLYAKAKEVTEEVRKRLESEGLEGLLGDFARNVK